MKRSKKMLIYLAALVVLVGGYFLATNLTKKEEVAQEAGTFALSAATKDTLTSLRWTKGEESISLEKKDGSWVNALDPDFPVDQDAVGALCESLSALQADRKLTGIENLADFGLSEPTFTVSFALSGGDEITYAMGADTALDSGHYISSSSEAGSVFIASQSLETMFDKSLNQLAKNEALPSFDAYTRLTVSANGQTTLDQSYNADQESKPWLRTGTERTPEPADQTAMDAVMTAIQGFTWNELVTSKADDLSVYGLEDTAATSVTVYNGDEIVWRVLLGGKDDSGNSYARLPDSRMVYTVLSATVNSLTGTTDESVRLKAVTDVTWDSVAEMSYDYDGTKHTIALSHESTTVGEGETAAEVVTVTATLDGREADADQYKEIYNAFRGLAVQGVSPAVNNGVSVLDVKLKLLDGSQVEYALRVNDVDTYLLDAGVERPLTVSADGVDKLIRQLKSL